MFTPMDDSDTTTYTASQVGNPLNLVGMVINTAGKQLYERQVECLINKDVERLVEENYLDDAVLVSGNASVRGKFRLKQHFQNYLSRVTIVEVKSTDMFVEAFDTIMFEATIDTYSGIVKVYNALILQDDKIAYHFTGVR